MQKIYLNLLLILTMSCMFLACSSEDEPTAENKTDQEYVSASEFNDLVKGTFWILSRVTSIKGDGTEYDQLLDSYLTGESAIQLQALLIERDVINYFWHPTAYRPERKPFAVESIPYNYDPVSGMLTLETYKAIKVDYKLLSVSDTELIMASFFGSVPKDFDPELYDIVLNYYGPDDNDGSMKVDMNDLDPDSYLKFYLRPATEEEIAKFWTEYEEND